MKKIIDRINAIRFNEKHTWIAIVGFAVLAYGIYLSWLGFYWDDWPWLHRAIFDGHKGMLEIDKKFRPFAGEVLWLGYFLAGNSAIGWQLFNIFNRIIAAFMFWLLLRELWPKNTEVNLWATLLFVIYPIDQQYAAINTSRHLFPYSIFIASLLFMLKAVKHPKKKTKWISLSVIFSILTNLTTEYYYGLEFIRPVILYFSISDTYSLKEKVKKTLQIWLPLLVVITVIFGWRYTISKSINYDVSLLSTIIQDPIQGILRLLSSIGRNIVATIFGVWKLIFLPLTDFTKKSTQIYYFLQIGSFAVIFNYLIRNHKSKLDKIENKRMLILGVFSLAFGSLSFLLADIPISARFPNSRGLYSMMFGGVLVIIGIINHVITKRKLKITIISIFFSLIIGIQFQISFSFFTTWVATNRFAQQFAIRVPNIAPGTKIISKQLSLPDDSYFGGTGILYSSDNSLSAMLNILYGYDRFNPEEAIELKYYRTRIENTNFEESISENNSGEYLFIHYDGISCLRLLDSQADRNLFHIYLPIRDLSIYSNLDRVIINSEHLANIDAEIFTRQDNSSWCQIFEEASLAIQQENWSKIPTLWKESEEEKFYPIIPDELSPFITGFIQLNNYEQAFTLTETAYSKYKILDKFLCSLWQQVHVTNPVTELYQFKLENLFEKNICTLKSN